MKKLLFIIPPYFNADDYLNKSRAAVLPAFTMPYGILSMESYLSARCRSTIDMQLLDLNITLQKLVDQRFEGEYAAVFAEEIRTRLRGVQPAICRRFRLVQFLKSLHPGYRQGL